ncbi:hypothetical protein GXW71_14365 [Roseomonas hellenica]|uniref:Uncharacterized protein n=1 Tax=Plastoroseomonas hellenica TaxID=2687306 RepID=A0ABS5EZ25_9PROT|nr:hypothetical protein [Plastoroseomonas hellenica]MBR0665542.1 hypothetical protein [Plastoroseomonas hellenica]
MPGLRRAAADADWHDGDRVERRGDGRVEPDAPLFAPAPDEGQRSQGNRRHSALARAAEWRTHPCFLRP